MKEIFQMPPGRMGYTTIKTIEETLRSKAGAMGATRKEIPQRLERLEAMGMFKRSRHARGHGEVEAGELVIDNPTVKELCVGLTQPEAAPHTDRAPRQPRLPRTPRESNMESPGTAEGTEGSEGISHGEPSPTIQLEGGPSPEAAEPALVPVESSPAPEDDGTHFRWVTPVAETPAGDVAADAVPDVTGVEAPAPAKRRATTTRRSPRAAGGAETTAKPRVSRARKKPVAADGETPAEGTETQAEN